MVNVNTIVQLTKIIVSSQKHYDHFQNKTAFALFGEIMDYGFAKWKLSSNKKINKGQANGTFVVGFRRHTRVFLHDF